MKQATSSSLLVLFSFFVPPLQSMDPPQILSSCEFETAKYQNLAQKISKHSRYFSNNEPLPDLMHLCISQKELDLLKANSKNFKTKELERLRKENLATLYQAIGKLRMDKQFELIKKVYIQNKEIPPAIVWPSNPGQMHRMPISTIDQKTVYISKVIYNASTTLRNCSNNCVEDETNDTVPVSLNTEQLEAFIKIDKQLLYTIVGNSLHGQSRYVKDRCLKGIQENNLQLNDICHACVVADFLDIEPLIIGLLKSFGKSIAQPIATKTPTNYANELYNSCLLLPDNYSYAQMILHSAKTVVDITSAFSAGSVHTRQLYDQDEYRDDEKKLLIIQGSPAIAALVNSKNKQVRIITPKNSLTTRDKENIQHICTTEDKNHIIFLKANNIIEIHNSNDFNKNFDLKLTTLKLNEPQDKIYVFANSNHIFALSKNKKTLSEIKSDNSESLIVTTAELIKEFTVSQDAQRIACIEKESNNLIIFQREESSFQIKREMKPKKITPGFCKIHFDNSGKKLMIAYPNKLLMYNFEKNSKKSIPLKKAPVDFLLSKKNSCLYVLTQNSFDIYQLKNPLIAALINKRSLAQILLLQQIGKLSSQQREIFFSTYPALKNSLQELFTCCGTTPCNCSKKMKDHLEYVKKIFLQIPPTSTTAQQTTNSAILNLFYKTKELLQRK